MKTELKNGYAIDEPMADYLAKKDHLGSSSIADIYYNGFESFLYNNKPKEEEEETDEQKNGKLVDFVVNNTKNPEVVLSKLHFFDARSKDDKAKKQELISQGCFVYPEGQEKKILDLVTNIQRSNNFNLFLGNKKLIQERSHYVEYKGVNCKCRPDMLYIPETGKALYISIKSTGKLGSFLNVAKTFHYGLKEQYHLELLEFMYGREFEFTLLCQEQQPPFRNFVGGISDNNNFERGDSPYIQMSSHSESIQFSLERYKYYLETGQYETWEKVAGWELFEGTDMKIINLDKITRF